MGFICETSLSSTLYFVLQLIDIICLDGSVEKHTGKGRGRRVQNIQRRVGEG